MYGCCVDYGTLLKADSRLCGGANEILGIPAPLWLRGWVVGGFMGWVGGWCACEGWVGGGGVVGWW